MKRFRLHALTGLLIVSVFSFAQDVQMNQPDHNSPSRDNNTTQSETNHTTSPAAIVAAWNDSHQIATTGVTTWTSIMSWGFSPAGASFTDAGLFSPPSGWQALGDPAVVVDSSGRFYVATLLTTDHAATIGGLAVSRSTGATPPLALGAPVTLTPMTAGDDFDKEFMAIDRSGGTNDGRIYMAISEGNFSTPPAVKVVVAHTTSTSPLTFSSWQAITTTTGMNHGAMPVVGPDGEVYVVWGNFTFTGFTLTGESIHIVKSTNGGGTFVNPDSSDPAPNKTIVTPNIAPNTLGSGSNTVRTRGFPYIAVDSSSAPTRGNVYLVYQADPDTGGPDHADIFFTRSTDGGAHWAAPRSISSSLAVTLNPDTTTHDNWQPSIAVSPVNGHIYVSFFDRRDDAGNTVTRVYRALSTDGGLTWGNAQLSTTSFTPSTGYDVLVSTYFGDYNWASADSSGIHFTWGDSRHTCAPPAGASSPCSPSGRGDQDVYYHHVANLSGPDLFIQPWGAVTGIGPTWQTPDIFVVDGMGNPTNAAKGIINHLRAQVRNIGNAAASGVTVRFKYAPWFAGITDADLKEIGTQSVSFSAAGGGSDTSVVAIDWDLTDPTDTNSGHWPAPISTFDHFCVKVTVEFASDINLSNNMAQNNFFDVGTGTSPLRFMVINGFKQVASARLVIGKVPEPFRVLVKMPGAEPGQEFRMKPGEVRMAEVLFEGPKEFQAAHDVVADINLLLNGKPAGGISARLYKHPGKPADLSGLPPFKEPLRPQAEPKPRPQAADERPAPKVEEPPMRTIPRGVEYKRTYSANFDTAFKAILAMLRQRKEGVSVQDLKRGLVNSGAVRVEGPALQRLVTPPDAKHVDEGAGRYAVSFWLQSAPNGKTIVGVDSWIAVDSVLDVPVGKRLHSNGTLEKGLLDQLNTFLRPVIR